MYPSSRDVVKSVGLQMINHYIGVCQETIACFIVDRPLFAICRDGERKRRSARCTFWCEQSLSINVTESLPEDKDDKGYDFNLNRGGRPFYTACCFDELNRGSVSCLFNASFGKQFHNTTTQFFTPKLMTMVSAGAIQGE